MTVTTAPDALDVERSTTSTLVESADLLALVHSTDPADPAACWRWALFSDEHDAPTTLAASGRDLLTRAEAERDAVAALWLHIGARAEAVAAELLGAVVLPA